MESKDSTSSKAPTLIAVILCGGNSSRMGQPKAFLTYHQIPQYQHLLNLAKHLKLPAFVSCRKEQFSWFKTENDFFLDQPKFANAGPMTGLLSAYQNIQENTSILLLACDYPLIQLEHISLLVQTYQKENKTCYFVNAQTKMPEPLLAIYPAQDLPKILENFHQNKTSLRNFLESSNSTQITGLNPSIFKSFDTPEDFASFG
jgi:molybdenum cofactor guanylyltransferase